MDYFDELKNLIEGDIDFSSESLKHYSTDASLFEVKPELIIFPKNKEDISKIVVFVNEYNKKSHDHKLNITARGAGTCMSGGSLNTSIILDFTKYINQIIEINPDFAIVEPGCFYRDFEKETLKIDRIMPAFTASKDICAIGGMVANNAGGEKSIRYGKTENYVEELEMVLNDGSIVVINKLKIENIKYSFAENHRQSDIYQRIWQLIGENYTEIMNNKPNVSKNSSGYYLWNVYDKENATLDLNKLIVGSQGTLGIITKIKLGLVPVPKNSGLLIVFLNKIDKIGEVVKEILPFEPESIESYDGYSLKLAVKFFPDLLKHMGFWKSFALGISFLQEAMIMLFNGTPKLILLIEATGQNKEEVKNKLLNIKSKIDKFNFKTKLALTKNNITKYWTIRHESFNLLRNHIKGKRTAPFIDDIIVLPEHMPEFLPKIEQILNSYKLIYTIAGHAGNGNFHIIPLMDIQNPFSDKMILDVSDKIYRLVAQYKGSITAEHNDGIIRTPYLSYIFSGKMLKLFKETKVIFDPENIFNPNKKVNGEKSNISKYLIKKEGN